MYYEFGLGRTNPSLTFDIVKAIIKTFKEAERFKKSRKNIIKRDNESYTTLPDKTSRKYLAV